MAISAGYKGLIKQFSIILFVLLALYLALVRPLAQQGVNMLEDQIRDTVSQLENYLPKEKEKFLPTKDYVKILKTGLSGEEQNYNILKNFIEPDKRYLPEGTQEPGLYFIEQLHITKKRLQRQASSLKIKIPDNFGFSEEMPEDRENVELLLKELDIVDRVTTLLMEEGVEEISLIKPLNPFENRDEKTEKLFYREIPIQLSFLCNSPILVKFLYQIKNFSPVLVMKDIIIKRAEGPSLQVEILLSRIVVS